MKLGKADQLLEVWMELQKDNDGLRDDLMSNKDLKSQSQELLAGLLEALKGENFDLNDSRYDRVKEILADVSISRAQRGYSPRETGLFVLMLKEAFFTKMKDNYGSDIMSFYTDMMRVNQLIDSMSLYTFEVYLKSREEVILRQRDEITDISTPVIKVWDQILAIPIIGTLDSSRTQVIMESLLTEIVNTGSKTAILDISGVPAVDSLVAQHLIKTVSATRLMGAECIISGIRPEIAQTMVHLGINLSDIATKASLASALQHAFKLQKIKLTKTAI